MKKLVNKLKKSKLLIGILWLTFYIVGKLPVRNNTIIFESFLGKQYSDNPKAIYEYLRETHPSYKLIWSIDKRYIGKFKDENLETVYRLSLKWIYLMATANYWVVNSRLPLWIPKPKHTTYIQTWHGTPLKKLGIDIEKVQMADTETKAYKRGFVKEASKWDYLISPNHYSTNIFRNAFKFNKQIIESGYPRNDVLYKKNNPIDIRGFKKKNNIPEDKKVILYAPTWRDNDYYQGGKYKFDIQLDLDKLKQEISDEYIIIFRLHYLVAENLKIEKYKNFIFDFSSHHDINELYLVSNILITDYSSVFFDYANLKRPILFYVYDLEDYRDNIRGFYFNLEEKAPGPLLKDTDQIINELKKIEESSYKLSGGYEKFYDQFCSLEDGNSTKRVVSRVFDE